MKHVLIAATATLGLAAMPHAAGAQDLGNIDAAQVEALSLYALPYLVDAVRGRCAPELAPDGYFATRGDALSAKLSAESAGAWTAARPIVMELMAGMTAGEDGAPTEADPMMAAVMAMPADVQGEAIGTFGAAMLVSELPTGGCGQFEEVMRLLDPLPARNLAGLAGTLFNLMGSLGPDEAMTDDMMMDDTMTDDGM